MSQQKSERRVVPAARRKAGETGRLEASRGGKAASVEEATRQLALWFGTADNRRAPARRAIAGAEAGPPAPAPRVAPKPKHKDRTASSTWMDEVCKKLGDAFQNVASNKGAPGPDHQPIAEVRAHLGEILEELTASLTAGTYQPGDVRRVWIPKAGGGQRGLGIPNVIDRVVQEAVRLVLEPVYEPTFHASSHGFRPGRSCHTAIAEAKGYLEEGYEYVVDLDLKDFFNRVHHQRLMARLAQRVHDKPLLELIGRMLKAKVVLPEGGVVCTDEGVPQGGPLSPLLSNIVLDELDWMLAERGHRFVRYADDSNIYVRSERAGQRVMASVTRFLEGHMRLEVNQAKSAVAKPEDRHFLGFSLRHGPLEGDVEVLLSKRSKERIGARLRELTPRNWGQSFDTMLLQLNAYLLGWLGYFGVCTAGQEMGFHSLDAHIRRRLRAVLLKQWKRKRFIVRNLITLKVKPKTAWRNVFEQRKSLWALSHAPAVHQGLRNAYFAERGLMSIVGRWKLAARSVDVPRQLRLALG